MKTTKSNLYARSPFDTPSLAFDLVTRRDLVDDDGAHGGGVCVQLLSVGHMLNDDRWHTVYIKRRGHQVELKIDVLRPVAGT